jgi:hypothetical protein
MMTEQKGGNVKNTFTTFPHTFAKPKMNRLQNGHARGCSLHPCY